MTRMTAFTLTERLRSPETAWAELTQHPELLFGHGAPDLVPGRSYAAISLRGSGGSARMPKTCSVAWRRCAPASTCSSTEL